MTQPHTSGSRFLRGSVSLLFHDPECLCTLLGIFTVTLNAMLPHTRASQSTPALSLPGMELAVASPLTSSPRTSCLYRLITWVRLSLACRISAGTGRRGEVGLKKWWSLRIGERSPPHPPYKLCKGDRHPTANVGPGSQAAVEAWR